MPMSAAEWEAFERRPGPAPFHHRGPAASSVRRALFHAQGGLCAICGLEIVRSNRSVDHVVPKSRGGKNRVGNLVMSHPACNARKGDRPPTGCELIWLLAVNNRLEVEPTRW